MEGALDAAYTAAKNADAAVMMGDIARAATLHGEASRHFDKVAEIAPDNPASCMLKALSVQHAARERFLQSGPLKGEVFSGSITSPTSYSSPLAVARGDSKGLKETARRRYSKPDQPTPKAVEAIVAKHTAAFLSRISVESVEAQRLQEATKELRTELTSEIDRIVNDYRQREQKLVASHTNEMAALTASNHQLNAQIERLKQRWNGLKESARRREREKGVD